MVVSQRVFESGWKKTVTMRQFLRRPQFNSVFNMGWSAQRDVTLNLSSRGAHMVSKAMKQLHRRLALSYARKSLSSTVPGMRSKISTGALLSSWPLNCGTVYRRFPLLCRNNSPIRGPMCLRLGHGGDHHD